MAVRIVSIAYAISLLAFPVSADESAEPERKMTLLVDGKPFPIQLGKPVKLSGEFQNPSIEVTAAPTRRFSYGGLQFDYPAYYTWEADIEDENYRSWTMSGNTSLIMYFVVAGQFTPEDYALSLGETFGNADVSASALSRKLGEVTLKGKRMVAQLGDTFITQDAFQIPSKKPGQSRLLVLQDVPPHEDPELKEAKQLLQLLSSSFQVTK